MSDLASKGIGRHVEELIGIQKKLKIINKIAGEQLKHAKNGSVSHPKQHENFENKFLAKCTCCNRW
jgi:hypothetical protein